MTPTQKHIPNDVDVFISHASEDKKNIVEPLAAALGDLGVKVWYDKLVLRGGDSLTQSIDAGLSRARYGLVLISPAFIAKRWTNYELKGLNSRGKPVIPVWHDVTADDLRKLSPLLEEKLAIKTAGKTPLQVAYSIVNIIRPDILENTHKRMALLEKERIGGRGKKINVSAFKSAGALFDKLPPDLVSRIRLIRASLLGAYTHSMEYWLDGFKRDAHPTQSIRDWEHIAAVYREYISYAPIRLSKRQHEEIISVILLFGSPGTNKEVKKRDKLLPRNAIETLMMIYGDSLPAIDIEEELPEKDDEGTEFLKNIDIDTEVLEHDLPANLVKQISTDLKQQGKDVGAVAAEKEDEPTEDVEPPEGTNEWYEMAAKSENDWIRAVVMRKDHPAHKRAWQEIEKLKKSIKNTLGMQHKEYGKLLLSEALYYDVVQNDGRLSARTFDAADKVLGEPCREYADAKTQLSAWYFEERKEAKAAAELADEALRILERQKGRELDVANIYLAKSVFSYALKDLDAAIELSKQALAIQREQKAYDLLQETKDRIAILVTEKGIKVAERSSKQAKKRGGSPQKLKPR